MTLPGGTSVEYIHDPLGRRIAKKINGVITEKYLWSGLTTLLAVYDGNNALKMRFEYADSRMPFAVMKAGVLYYLIYDQIGSLKLIAGSAGNVVKRIEYDTFGNVISDSAPSFEIPFGFAGGLYDRDTGLVRFGFRDYDPETGRWTAKDPIGFAGGDTDLYGYCLNDPVNFVDPEGKVIGYVIGGAILGGYAIYTGWKMFNSAEKAREGNKKRCESRQKGIDEYAAALRGNRMPDFDKLAEYHEQEAEGTQEMVANGIGAALNGGSLPGVAGYGPLSPPASIPEAVVSIGPNIP